MLKKPLLKEDFLPKTKAYVLDTSVLIHDPSCLFQFKENDVFIPMKVLEELDHKKSGHSEPARNARQAVRHISSIMKDNVKSGGSLPDLEGRLFLLTEPVRKNIPLSLSPDVPDNHIIGAAFCIQKRDPRREVIVVSNDIALRTKAMACDLKAQEYHHDRAVEDISFLPGGIQELPENFWEDHMENARVWKDRNGCSFYEIESPLKDSLLLNEFVYLEKEDLNPFYARVIDLSPESKTLTLATVKNFTRYDTWGIKARNREQMFALDALLNPNIDLVSLLGQAGSGKTLLALAAGLHQTFDQKRYREIIMTRATVSIGEDIGFLPGTEEEKMAPWLGALMDNLEVLCPSPNTKDGNGNGGNGNGNGEGKGLTQEILRNRIKVKSMNFMRGRTLNERYLIIDEAQNITPKQVKTLVTRAGPGTKVVLLGNNAQIDTPYLTETNSGITYAVKQFLGWRHSAHVILARCERSRLADHAEEVL